MPEYTIQQIEEIQTAAEIERQVEAGQRPARGLGEQLDNLRSAFRVGRTQKRRHYGQYRKRMPAKAFAP